MRRMSSMFAVGIVRNVHLDENTCTIFHLLKTLFTIKAMSFHFINVRSADNKQDLWFETHIYLVDLSYHIGK